MVTEECVQYLKHTKYHWILGLRTFTAPCQPNLWNQIHAMQPSDVAMR